MSFSRKMKSSQKTFLILIFSGALFLIYSFRYEISLKILIFGTKIDLFWDKNILNLIQKVFYYFFKQKYEIRNSNENKKNYLVF